MTPTMSYLLPPLMLVASNVFMTLAWYGHLKFKATPLLVVILVSWGIALAEYCLAVPANRIGHGVYSAAQLKTIQEIITIAVFVAFSFLYLKESIAPSQLLGLAMIAGGAALVFFKPWG
ncbi:DMT family protein [Thalassobaculum salexigens]|uniref:DMT family protein n=1 Tax=Thalassobaculum salexigens TaxID=455360 RepID=UPI000409A91E|nr:DMT family protein [Thalassobaculum salexigens]